VVKTGRSRQVVIPKQIWDKLNLQPGDYIQFQKQMGYIRLIPKKLVGATDILSPEEEKIVRQGEKQIRRGESITWKKLKGEQTY
jgi:AbrB family looped-hinge helix DNA binding protein